MGMGLADMYMAQQERLVELGIYAALRRADLRDEDIEESRSVIRQVIADEEMLNRLAAHAEAIEGLHLELEPAKTHVDKAIALLDEYLAIGQDQPE